jgi:predicted nucleotidyltransferase
VKTKINKHYEDILRIIEEKLDSRTSIRSVVGIGSYFSERHDTASDIDLILLSEIEKNCRFYYDIQGTSYEFFLFGINKFTAMMNGKDVCFVPAMVSGEVIYDVDDIGFNLKILANSIYGARKHSVSSRVLNGSRLRINSCLRKMRYADFDLPLFCILYGKLVLYIYKLLCIHFLVWEKSEKHMLEHIRELSPNLYDELILCSNFETKGERMYTLQIILDEIFEQIGGISNIESMVI